MPCEGSNKKKKKMKKDDDRQYGVSYDEGNDQDD